MQKQQILHDLAVPTPKMVVQVASEQCPVFSRLRRPFLLATTCCCCCIIALLLLLATVIIVVIAYELLKELLLTLQSYSTTGAGF